MNTPNLRLENPAYDKMLDKPLQDLRDSITYTMDRMQGTAKQTLGRYKDNLKEDSIGLDEDVAGLLSQAIARFGVDEAIQAFTDDFRNKWYFKIVDGLNSEILDIRTRLEESVEQDRQKIREQELELERTEDRLIIASDFLENRDLRYQILEIALRHRLEEARVRDPYDHEAGGRKKSGLFRVLSHKIKVCWVTRRSRK
ncbi:hypothetical protein LTR99_007872 [Exophiala xenobiotica]|uniref:Uncharacterized protein n=1 Tax=Vermiconidia calcicola TaxID=1690605 RepID=A0AAV9Q4J8_9PEZI|nr:hypothetical protein LTR72_005235 [Exophiala xenobiotica]KAK5534753.1 hypothetical protein LTR23_008684 [Chaetothyriales sp. CCFEE 6169]KAK5535158.1 hypothetical protein LTR25_006166 [Vermiconidia calcicola]KAK5273558.1 hypothetical protein LTR96_000158 [Exophiala xenobiotica]KAK5289250.1 hypothetical protein LTR14_007501 [Exophiala xenobiotica]